MEVGSGLNRFLPIISSNADLTVVDTLYDESNIFDHSNNCSLLHQLNIELIIDNWSDYLPDNFFDCIIANDIFPNVDQRLSTFLPKFFPFCKELRLSLTVHSDKSELVRINRTGEHIMM